MKFPYDYVALTAPAGVGQAEGRRRGMNDILKREVEHAYIPQDVQVAIDTILAWGYSVKLENQVLRRRLEDAHRILDGREIDMEIAATHTNTEASESTRICKIINEMPYETQEGGAK